MKSGILLIFLRPVSVLFALALSALPLLAQNGSRTWTGAVDDDFYNAGNWSGTPPNFPNGHATCSGNTNTTIVRTSNNYNYLFGLFFTNELGTDSAFTIGATPGSGTHIFWGGPLIRTTAISGTGSLTDTINSNIAFGGSAAAGQTDKVIDLGANHNLHIAGTISGGNTTDYTFTKKGAGTLTLSGANTYNVVTTVEAGVLEITDKGALGSTTTGTVVQDGATVRLNFGGNGNLSTGESFTITGAGVDGAGALDVINSDISGAINLDGDATIKVTTRFDHSSTIGGSGTLTKTGTGVMVRGGAITADNLVVAEGEYLATGNSLVAGDADTANGGTVTVRNGAFLTLWKTGITNTPDIVLEGNAKYKVSSNTADQVTSIGGTMRLDGDVKFENWNHKHTINSDISGTGGIELTSLNSAADYPEYTFAGNNTYSGATRVGNGQAARKIVLNAGSTSAFSSNSAFQVTANNTLRLKGFDNTVGSLSGDGTVENAAATDATLTTGADNSDSSFGGTMQDGAGGGKLGVKKIGTGNMTLTGTNDYTGETNIDAGTLTVNSDNSGATGNVFVNSGATLAGQGTIGGSTTVKNGASLKPGSSHGVLTFNDYLTLEAGSTTTMEITGTTRGTGYDGIDVAGLLTFGGDLVITSDTSILAGTYTLFDFQGGSTGDFNTITLSGTAYNSNALTQSGDEWMLQIIDKTYTFSQVTGNLVVVPEPDAFALLASLLCFSWVALRRRKQ